MDYLAFVHYFKTFIVNNNNCGIGLPSWYTKLIYEVPRYYWMTLRGDDGENKTTAKSEGGVADANASGSNRDKTN